MDWQILNNSRKELTDKIKIRSCVFDKLIERYLENGLAYHNLNHIAYCLDKYNKHKDLARDPLLVQTAIWFHDVIYIPGDKNNELKSGVYAQETLLREYVDLEFSRRVRDIIIESKYNSKPKDNDTIILRDIDLSILGDNENKYLEYSKKIRSEYWFISDDMFAVGRRTFLKELISNEKIFLNPVMSENYEMNALKNIHNEISRLDSYINIVKNY